MLLYYGIERFALMVKRLRRCPLTAESGVRVPLGVPNKYATVFTVAYLFYIQVSGLNTFCSPPLLLQKNKKAKGGAQPSNQRLRTPRSNAKYSPWGYHIRSEICLTTVSLLFFVFRAF